MHTCHRPRNMYIRCNTHACCSRETSTSIHAKSFNPVCTHLSNACTCCTSRVHVCNTCISIAIRLECSHALFDSWILPWTLWGMSTISRSRNRPWRHSPGRRGMTPTQPGHLGRNAPECSTFRRLVGCTLLVVGGAATYVAILLPRSWCSRPGRTRGLMCHARYIFVVLLSLFSSSRW